jgi:hypothetical protein
MMNYEWATDNISIPWARLFPVADLWGILIEDKDRLCFGLSILVEILVRIDAYRL